MNETEKLLRAEIQRILHAANVQAYDSETTYPNGVADYWYSVSPPNGNDLNRDIFPPGEVAPKGVDPSEAIPSGGLLLIRNDSDFFIVARLPYELCHFDFSLLVQELWPTSYKDFDLEPDSSSPVAKRLHKLQSQAHDMRNAFWENMVTWPVTILKIERSSVAGISDITLHNEIDDQIYYSSMFNYKLGNLHPDLRTVLVGRIRPPNGIDIGFFMEYPGSHTFENAVGARFTWIYEGVTWNMSRD